MITTTPKILKDYEYFAEITRKIATTHAGDRVSLMTMSFGPDEPLLKPVMRELVAAAKRGATVQLNVDAQCFMIGKAYLPIGPIVLHHEPAHTKRAYFQAKYAMLEKLHKNGGHYCITNLPKHLLSNPFGGRSHIKFTVINDIIYIGGCNLEQTHQLDIMVRFQDPSLANWATNFMHSVAQTGSPLTALQGKDTTIPIDNVTTLFVDAGQKHRSLIYDQALKLIDEAKEWIVLTCQFFPGSTTAAHLDKAIKRGVAVELYFGHQSRQGFMSLGHRVVEFGEQFVYPKELFLHRMNKTIPRLHAKLLATENGVLIGSHNYVTQGVNYGTAEATFLRRDPQFAYDAASVIKSRISEALKSTVL